MSASVPAMLTVGEIARRLSERHHRVEYVIRSRGICPIGWAGNARVFAEAAVARIESELHRIDEEREQVGPRADGLSTTQFRKSSLTTGLRHV